MRRCHPASGSRPALNLRCFVASRFPLLRPAESQPPFQGNLSEGSVLFIEFLLFYHLRRLERKHVLANMASMEQISQFWTDCRQPLPNRVTSELPVIREEFSKRVPLDLPVPDFWPGFGVPQSGAKRLNGIWGSQIRVCRIPIRASIQQASEGILDGCAKLRSADRRGTGGNSAGPSLQPSSRLKEPARDFR